MFNFSFFIFSITLLFLIIASFSDLKKRTIPNSLVFSLLILGVIMKIIEAITFSEINIFLNASLSFIITVFVSYILWEVGLFAGGDLKLFAAISFLNPFNLNFLGFIFSFGVINWPIFALTLIIVSILSTAPLLILHSLYYFIFKGHHFILWEILKSKNNISSFINSVLIIFFISSFLNIFSLNISYLIYFLFSIFFLLFFRKIEKHNKNHFYYLISIFYVCLIIYSIICKQNLFSFYDFITIVIMIKLIFLLVTIYRIISEKILKETKKIKDLKEGDVVYNNYYKIGYKTIEKNISFINYIKQTIKNNYSKNLIIDSRKVGGLTSKDITFLKSSYKHNLEKPVILKKTIPFTPSVLIGYLILNVLGDFIWMLI